MTPRALPLVKKTSVILRDSAFIYSCTIALAYQRQDVAVGQRQASKVHPHVACKLTYCKLAL